MRFSFDLLRLWSPLGTEVIREKEDSVVTQKRVKGQHCVNEMGLNETKLYPKCYSLLVGRSGEQSEVVSLSGLDDKADRNFFEATDLGKFHLQLRSVTDLEEIHIAVAGGHAAQRWLPDRITVICNAGSSCEQAWTTVTEDLYSALDGTNCTPRLDSVKTETNEVAGELSLGLQLTVDNGFDAVAGQLSITVCKATALVATDCSGSSDPYVTIRLGSQPCHKTTVQKNTLDPIWDESFTLDVESLGDEVILQVVNASD